MNKQNVKIYDYFYSMVIRTSKLKVEISDEEKSKAIDDIFNDMDFEDINAIRTITHHRDIMNPSIWKGVDKKKIHKKYETAWKRMYYPQHIAIAVPWFYETEPYVIVEKPNFKLKEEDFDGKKYIITALNKSGIYYRYQLKKHLSLGWRYLWTIPGIGDGAKQTILTAIDHGLLNW